VGAMSVAAGSTLAVAVGANCINSIQECGKRVIATPTLAAEAFDVPSYRSADGRPAIHAEVEYTEGQAQSSKFAVFNGEALMVGPDPKQPQPVLLVGGQQVLLEGNTVKLVPQPVSEVVTLKFSNPSEAQTWKSRMEEAANANNLQAKFVRQYSQVVESERQMKLLQERIQECQEMLEKSEKTLTEDKNKSDEEWQKKATERDEQIKALKKENQDLKDQVDGPPLDISFDGSFKRAEAQRVEAEGRVQRLEDKLNALTEGKCMPWIFGMRSISKSAATEKAAASSSVARPKASANSVDELAQLAMVERAKVEAALADLERHLASSQGGGAAGGEADASKLAELAAQHAKVKAAAASLQQRLDSVEQASRQAQGASDRAPLGYDQRLQEMEMRKKEVEEQAKLLTQRIALLEKAEKEPKVAAQPAGVPQEQYMMLQEQFKQLQASYQKQAAVPAGVPADQHNMLQTEFSNLQESYKKALSQLDSTSSELQVAKESEEKLQQVAQRLAEDNQQLKKSLTASDAAEVLQSENQTLQTRLAEAESKAQQLEEKDKANQLQLREADKKKALLKKEFEDEYITLRNDVAQEKKAVADERRLRQVAEEEGQALRQQVADLMAAKEALERQAPAQQQAESSLQQLQAQLTQATTAAQAAEAARSQAESQLRQQQQSAATQAAQANAMSQESMALKQRLQEAEAAASQAAPLQATVAKLQDEVKQLQLKLSRQSTASQSSTEEMSKRLEYMVTENTELKKELKSTWSKISDQSKKMDEERDAFWKELQAVQRQSSGNLSAPSSPAKEVPLSPASQGLGSSRRLQPSQVVRIAPAMQPGMQPQVRTAGESEVRRPVRVMAQPTTPIGMSGATILGRK